MEISPINADANLPEAFFEIVKPYVDADEPEIITDEGELLALWQAAIIYAKDFPNQQDSIAEWTVAAAATSPLVKDEGIFETIHILFKGLINAEIDEGDEDWREVELHVGDLKDELGL